MKVLFPRVSHATKSLYVKDNPKDDENNNGIMMIMMMLINDENDTDR